jgi:cell division protein FtsB
MDQTLEKSSVKSPEAAKKPELQKLKAPSGFAEEISKYPSSFMDGILKFLCHPFILLGGIMVAIYFFYKARQSGINSENTKLRDTNKELLSEVRTLRKENKNFKDQLGLLPGDEEYDYPVREKKLLTTGKKKITVARLE